MSGRDTSRRRSVLDTNVNVLVALDALVRERSVTRAAHTIGITQSSMSGVLAQLREMFADPLLVRVGRTMQPTPLALRLHADVRRGVEAFDAALAGGRRFDPATSRDSFTIALSDRCEAVLFPRLLAALRATAPGVAVQVLPWSGLEPPPGLSAGGVDLSIGIVVADLEGQWPSAPRMSRAGDHIEPLWDSGLVSMVRADHPRVGKRLTLPTFCALEHILVTEKPGARGIVDDALARAGRSRTIAVRVPRHTLVAELVERTDLVATIDRRVAKAAADRHGLRLYKPPVALPRGTFGMIWHERVGADPANQWFRDQVRLAARGL